MKPDETAGVGLSGTKEERRVPPQIIMQAQNRCWCPVTQPQQQAEFLQLVDGLER